MKRSCFRFAERIRVRWAEVDMQKIVFNGHYILYADTAMAGYWRALALPYQATMEHLGGDLYVRKATLEYHGSAEYDDTLEVGMRCEHIGNSSLRFLTGVFRAEELLVSGELVYVYADPEAKRSQPVPQALRQVLMDFEAGQPMVEVRIGAWGDLGADASRIRHEVFVQEQHIPVEMASDATDADAVHAVAYNAFGVPLAAGRLLVHAAGEGRIGRMAVSRPLRGSQIGREVLLALLGEASRRGDKHVMLHAQASAVGFYLRNGFTPRGPAFEEAGIAHQEMVSDLA
ncbi:MAG: YbgC/FadM family acyl-CoA thioesterase [Burkholderiales bacterium]|nr:YbgC/FadM family acyl-CoA thioesterase [Burkholderiales bacterium]